MAVTFAVVAAAMTVWMYEDSSRALWPLTLASSVGSLSTCPLFSSFN